MKKFPAYLFLSLLFLLTIVTVAKAQTVLPGSTASGTLKTQRQEAVETLKQTKDAIKLDLEQARQNAQAKYKEARAEYEAKLAEIKDQRKKQITERIDKKLAEINKNRLEHFQERLTRLTNLLDKIASRKDKAKLAGKNVTAVETAILKARDAIAAAKALATTQAGNEYVMTFKDEAGLQVGASAAKTKLHTDLKNINDKVVAARKAVTDALKALALVKNVDEDATASAKETP